ncbi:50S ribosomal protein L18 [Candidatus Falkowbacteria bacterium]|jgi:large subunit ribosomal protein L18|nr:50S ribosomal protein L18 [Candidatus Falkowbacteria bacterium]MBT5503003.1 50S ribosomal protein L18 [Candidatus Falkowbacteria bacterium]MBT6574359.1 50S ribosomal protein L18 [Candidatus Falkowbacteria bacterium]MBT7349048.1 50S ribosomal protein L18 [Candidatus Falkowbacteria bacterium]MBT7500958.1 50S ribosomal protein L18 [Candidatus Falkowbacteria bacterium]
MKNREVIKFNKFKLRQKRTRAKIVGKLELPRLTVKRSLKHFYMQIIDDKNGQTICAVCDKDIKVEGKKPVEVAKLIGQELAKKAKEKKIEKVRFDRGAYKYHGRVKAAAEGAREQGLEI